MPDLFEDKQTRKKRKVWAWLSAVIGVILLNVSITAVSMGRASAWGWAQFGVGLLFLGLALRLMRWSL